MDQAQGGEIREVDSCFTGRRRGELSAPLERESSPPSAPRLSPAAAAAATAGEGENAHGHKRQKRRANVANDGSSHGQFLLGLWNMRARESSKRAGGTLAALRFHLPQEGVWVTLHLGDAAATADVDGLSLDRYRDGRPHVAQRLARDGTGLLSSVKSLAGQRGRWRAIRRDRITAIGRRRGQRIDSRGTGAARCGRRIVRRRPSTATAATAATSAAAIVLAAVATAAAGEHYQGHNQEPSAGAGEAKRPCHHRTSLSGRYTVAVGL
jgi:hypothetical protein